ncbi:hypothetical protein BGW36DRAFT_364071 [Talaromyces proteolyticus]|uniref:Uncharacterized protein n=1 Tax=Talaromyces proteolyticus TaxID=1131652 RepID=A0AAD4KKC2_9EURO|nr:uncharacterized protein BGW36DRAFT_364071 [Talaromyces proteolyticus]KAH8690493.1 hypothetical protein BGW36DRAFT_364071 [Talaromyces proteolyticus]
MSRTGRSEPLQFVQLYYCSALDITYLSSGRTPPRKRPTKSLLKHLIDLRMRNPNNLTSKEYMENVIVLLRAGDRPVNVERSLAEDGLSIAASLTRQPTIAVNLSSDYVKNLKKLVRMLSFSEKIANRIDYHDMDMLMNTWYAGEAKSYGFGAGVPKALRLHRDSWIGAYCMVLPNFSEPSTDQGFDVFMQIREDEFEELEKDDNFMTYSSRLN